MGILHLLAARVGPDGRVVGLDREPRMVEAGRELAGQRNLKVELIEADATATGLNDGTFDLVHSRTLLLNVANPEEILTEMIRIAQPGGVIAVQEPDASGWSCDPPHPAFKILRSEILSAYRRTGMDFSIGRRWPARCRRWVLTTFRFAQPPNSRPPAITTRHSCSRSRPSFGAWSSMLAGSLPTSSTRTPEHSVST